MTDVYVVVAVVVSAIFAVAVKVANDRGYDRGFKDGMWFERTINHVSWDTAIDAIMEDCHD